MNYSGFALWAFLDWDSAPSGNKLLAMSDTSDLYKRNCELIDLAEPYLATGEAAQLRNALPELDFEAPIRPISTRAARRLQALLEKLPLEERRDLVEDLIYDGTVDLLMRVPSRARSIKCDAFIAAGDDLNARARNGIGPDSFYWRLAEASRTDTPSSRIFELARTDAELAEYIVKDGNLTADQLTELASMPDMPEAQIPANANCPAELADRIARELWPTAGPLIYSTNSSAWVNKVAESALSMDPVECAADRLWSTALLNALHDHRLSSENIDRAFMNPIVYTSPERMGTLMANPAFPSKMATGTIETVLRSGVAFRAEWRRKSDWLIDAACNPGVSNQLRLQVLQWADSKTGPPERTRDAASWARVDRMVRGLDAASALLGDQDRTMSTALLKSLALRGPIKFGTMSGRTELVNRLGELDLLTAEQCEKALGSDKNKELSVATSEGAFTHGAEAMVFAYPALPNSSFAGSFAARPANTGISML